MAIFALISWLKNPYNGNRTEVKVNKISKRELIFMWIVTIITAIFYFVLEWFNTANIVLSINSVITSFLAVYPAFRRSAYSALAYASNDIVLIVLWILASIYDIHYLSVAVCFVAFLFNDIYGFISWHKIERKQENHKNI